MSFGKLYGYTANNRVVGTRAVAKLYGLDIELVDPRTEDGMSEEYLKINPLGKVPTFVGADGFVLTESIAIAVYVTSQNEKTALLGKTKQDYASILRWMCLVNQDLAQAYGQVAFPLVGRVPYNKKSVEEGMERANKMANVIEQHLMHHTFLVGERMTLADLFTVPLVSVGFKYFFDKKWREEHPSIEPEYIEEALKNQPPKKEPAPKKEAAPKPAAAPKAKAKEVVEKDDGEDDEDDKPAPKPKHALEELGKPSMVLDDWKRKYSNEPTRTVAMPWFWEHYKPEDYSLWRVDYKYNDELTQVFMSANLIGGFFNRLEASRKYIFGAASVYGKANDSVIVGAFLVRGTDAMKAFDVAPDRESYTFTKLDASKEADRVFVEDQWEMEKGVTIDGKEHEYADGKVFK
ncbi:MAG: hypothetical protein M1826_004092 [Phylliscum demangeonii]|nr:MAG: hypothetical protein M1826_004092 [Phylliscum demangeonii]